MGKTERIGIAGSGPSVGVTHFSILTAGYLAGVLKKKTAVLEWNGSGDFSLLEEVRAEKTVTNREQKTFNILGISFYKEAGAASLIDCGDQKFDAAVVDFGRYQESIREEFLRCDRRFLVCSASDWQLPQASALIVEEAGRRNRWEYFSAFGGEEALRMMERYLGIRIRRIPFSRDAFVINSDLMVFFGRFLK